MLHASFIKFIRRVLSVEVDIRSCSWTCFSSTSLFMNLLCSVAQKKRYGEHICVYFTRAFDPLDSGYLLCILNERSGEPVI